MKRPPYYFKLKKEVRLKRGFTDGTATFSISGEVMKRGSLWAGLDETVQYLSEEYGGPEGYNAALLSLEGQALKICEKLCEQEGNILAMIEGHEANLKKLNLGYKLIGWFRGMGDKHETT